jgi:D-arginine dehydrogenase
LCESEPLLCAHASGRNAAIYRPLEYDATTATLAARSLARLQELGGEACLSRTGVLLAAGQSDPIDAFHEQARAQGVVVVRLDRAALHAHAPLLAGGELAHALLVPDGGVLDIHAMTSRLTSAARAAGAELRTGASVAELIVERGALRGVLLHDGTRLVAGHVVLAAGAWGAALGVAVGAALPLQPVRRHLVQLALPEPAGLSPQAPVVWRVDAGDELYFRPESGGLLASPCDAQPNAPPVSGVERGALELLAQKLARSAPGLAHAQVRSAWTCLRTFASDRELVVGPDPRVPGLCWLGGLGGRGMAVAVTPERFA